MRSMVRFWLPGDNIRTNLKEDGAFFPLIRSRSVGEAWKKEENGDL